ncbi:MAG TPA: ribosome maturation factor RimM [Bryobacteraceae bacterium]|nr:ribosome maturation factor RimM [Bryobacteraceae bacterium]
MNESGGWIAVGRLGRPRGNRGEFTAEIYSSQPGRAERLHEVRLERNGAACLARLERVWYHEGRPILKFEGVDSISSAEQWQGADILVPESERALPGEGEYSHADLIGCELAREEDGRSVGIVREIEEYGSAPLLRVEAPDGREILVPFVHAICRDIDLTRKRILVRLPEGLADL